MQSTESNFQQVTEAEFQADVVKFLRQEGWRVATVGGSGDSDPGFPDLLAVKPDRMVFVELKSAGGALTERQRFTIELLRKTGQSVHVFRPSEWHELRALLGPRERADTIRQIAEQIADHFGVSIDEIYSRSRRSDAAQARQIVMYAARQRGMTTVEIGAALDRDHSTIVHGVANVARKLKHNTYERPGIEAALSAAGVEVSPANPDFG